MKRSFRVAVGDTSPHPYRKAPVLRFVRWSTIISEDLLYVCRHTHLPHRHNIFGYFSLTEVERVFHRGSQEKNRGQVKTVFEALHIRDKERAVSSPPPWQYSTVCFRLPKKLLLSVDTLLIPHEHDVLVISHSCCGQTLAAFQPPPSADSSERARTHVHRGMLWGLEGGSLDGREREAYAVVGCDNFSCKKYV